jgi:protein-L-isoaspartate(D-aspartate) O-methyltransferase
MMSRAEAPLAARSGSRPASLAKLVRECAVPFPAIESADLGSLLERIGDARVVLLGEASHGTSEFYRMRDHITRALIRERGFTIVAAEADWPDAAAINRYTFHLPPLAGQPIPFTRFPTWMWRNAETAEFVEWLRSWNGPLPWQQRVSFYGLDLYSLYTSIAAVLRYLDQVDPDFARLARARYACLIPWEGDVAAYGAAALARQPTCEAPIVAMLNDLLRRRLEYIERDGAHFLDAVQNARVIANAERYYRIMYHGSVASWNLRDSHMFETLESVLAHHGPGARAVVWAHNSHVGDAGATEMGLRGEHNIGYLARQAFGMESYRIGFGTDHGTVAAANNWDEPMQIMAVRPSHPDSYEALFHESGVAAFLLHLREPNQASLREELLVPRLERAIGVIYRPDTELQSHYFQAILPEQFDEYIWFDETAAVTALSGPPAEGMPETWPFGL